MGIDKSTVGKYVNNVKKRRVIRKDSWLLLLGAWGILFSLLSAFLLPPQSSVAINETIDPNGDGSVGFPLTGATSHFEALGDLVRQPNIPNTSDYISDAANSNSVDYIRMSTISNIQSVTEVTVWVYHNDSTNAQFLLQLYDDDETTTRSTQGALPQQLNVDGWNSVTFSGLSLSQIQLDTLSIRISTQKSGTGSPTTGTMYALYADVTYSTGPQISITTDGTVDMGAIAPGNISSTSPSDLNDVQTISIDGDTVNLDVRSTNFSDGGNTWSLGVSAGSDQVQWEFSPDGSIWTTFAAADTLYSLDTNVPNGETRDLHLRMTAPSSSSSFQQHSATVTVVATTP